MTETESQRQWWYRRADWQPTFSVLPRRCDLSGRWIWGRHMLGTLMITGPGDPVILRFWNHRHEYTMRKLKGK